MSDLQFATSDIVLLGIVCLIIFYVYLTSGGGNVSYGSEPDNYSPNNSDLSKLYKKIEKYSLTLEELYIKREEMENEIEKLSYDGSFNFEKESENNTKIKKLKLNLKHLDIKIEDITNNISSINNEIQGM